MKNAILKIYLSNFKLRHLFVEIIIFTIFISVLFFLLTPDKIETAPAGWDRKLSFTPSSQKVGHYSVFSRGNYISIAYEAEEKGKYSLFIMVSLNSGRDFFDPVKIAEANLQQSKNDYRMNPNITLSSNGRLFLVWQDFDKTTFEPKIYFSHSVNNGAGWSLPEEFSLESGIQFLPRIVFDGKNRLHVFYHVYENDAFFLYHIYEKGGIGVFTAPEKLVKLDGTFRGAFFPAIISRKKDMFIAWQGKGVNQNNLSDDLFFMKSSDYGENFSRSVKMTSSPANDASPFLSVNGSKLSCVYLNNANGNWEIYLTESDDDGRTWSSEPVNVFATNINSYDPVVVSDNHGGLIFFWYNIDNGHNTIFSRKFTTAEQSVRKFDDIRGISQNRSDALSPSVLSLDGSILCLWLESGSVKGKFSDTYVAPPEVFSLTHPYDRWSKKSVAYINWKKPFDESGIAGYATIINKDPDFNPTVQNYESNVFSTRTGTLDDGISYFHIRAIDTAGNFSRTVHYPLLVSSTPLMMPHVFSSTHNEGKKSELRTVTFGWKHPDEIRIKGYRYSFALNSIVVPDKFTTGNEITFDHLEDGHYFFQVQAIDKTNTFGRIATYEIIIGAAGELDPDIYSKIAEQERTEIKPVVIKHKYMPVVPKFTIEVRDQLPLVTPETVISVKLLNSGELKNVTIDGFEAVYRTSDGIQTLFSESELIFLKGLDEGNTIVSVRAKYSYSTGGKAVEKWTDSSEVSIQVRIPDVLSPLESFEERLFSDISGAGAACGVIVVIGLFMVVMSGFKGRIVFFGKLFVNRIVLKLRLAFSGIIN